MDTILKSIYSYTSSANLTSICVKEGLITVCSDLTFDASHRYSITNHHTGETKFFSGKHKVDIDDLFNDLLLEWFPFLKYYYDFPYASRLALDFANFGSLRIITTDTKTFSGKSRDDTTMINVIFSSDTLTKIDCDFTFHGVRYHKAFPMAIARLCYHVISVCEDVGDMDLE